MKIKKKKLRRIQGELRLARAATTYVRELHRRDVEQLESRVYELEHTPEIKADTEKAFQRGIGHGKMLARAAIVETLTKMGTDGSSPLPVPDIPGKPGLVPLPPPPSMRLREPDAAE